MTKIAVNKCFGGFSLSQEAMEKLVEYGMPVYDDWESYGSNERPEVHIVRNKDYKGTEKMFDREYYLSHCDKQMDMRTHPLVIKVIEELGDKANGSCASIKIVDVPREIYEVIIEEYDGTEWVSEKHETW